VWLCRPGQANDPCTANLDATVFHANGTTTMQSESPAKDPPIDCFYVYPTVSGDRGMNSDLVPDNGEISAAQNQFARFAGVCRTFAPLYRQMTVASIAALLCFTSD